MESSGVIKNNIFVRWIGRAVALILAVFLCVALAQITAMVYFSFKTNSVFPADLVVVFPGEKERYVAASRIAAKQRATPALMSMSETSKTITNYAKKENVPASATIIAGGGCRSTAENAYKAAKAIEKLEYKRVFLVTSAYHMPRSLFLLKGFLAIFSTNVDIKTYCSENSNTPIQNLKNGYNEIVKLWGSAVEFVGYLIFRKSLMEIPIINTFRTWIKQVILLEV